MFGCLSLLVRWRKGDHLTRETCGERVTQEPPSTVFHSPIVSPYSSCNEGRGHLAPKGTLNTRRADGVTTVDELPPPPPYQATPTEAPRQGDTLRAGPASKQSASPHKKLNLEPALLIAIREGDVDSAIKLLQRGANPNVKDSYGSSLAQAVRGGYEMLAMELLRRGADSKVKDSYGSARVRARN